MNKNNFYDASTLFVGTESLCTKSLNIPKNNMGYE